MDFLPNDLGLIELRSDWGQQAWPRFDETPLCTASCSYKIYRSNMKLSIDDLRLWDVVSCQPYIAYIFKSMWYALCHHFCFWKKTHFAWYLLKFDTTVCACGREHELGEEWREGMAKNLKNKKILPQHWEKWKKTSIVIRYILFELTKSIILSLGIETLKDPGYTIGQWKCLPHPTLTNPVGSVLRFLTLKGTGWTVSKSRTHWTHKGHVNLENVWTCKNQT